MKLDDQCNPDDEALHGLRAINVHNMLLDSTSIEETECGEQCGVRVVVTSVYDEGRFDESRGHMFFYRVLFENIGKDVVQLMGRHWKFYCGDQVVSEVPKFGNGVIGLYPTLKPGEAFQYMSCATIPEPVGEMRGSFQFSNESNGTTFEVFAPNRLLVPNSKKKKGTAVKRK
jgi:ApaG protein